MALYYGDEEFTTKITTDTVKVAADYSSLPNKPSINSIELIGNLTSEDLGLASSEDLTNYATKTEVDAKVSSVYRFKGSVANYDSLPTSELVTGDVYNIESSGANYAWTGNDWDKLSETVDLSAYATKEEVALKQDKGDYALRSELPVVPSNVSAFTNDAGYLTEHQDISGKAEVSFVNEELALKADKSTTYTKTEVDNLIENFDSLPDQTDNTGKFLSTDGTNATWSEIPDTITKVSELENDAGYLTSNEVYSKVEVDNKFSSVVDITYWD